MYVTYLASGIIDPDFTKDGKVCSQAKYFLVKLLQLYGFDKAIDKNYKDLGKELGVSDHLARSAVSFLVEKGYLMGQQPEGGARERLAGRYRVYKEALWYTPPRQASQQTFFHHRLIDDLLLPDTAVNYKHRRHPIKLPTRLLLTVLLSRADRCGTVKSVSSEELGRLTGLRGAKLGRHLCRLQALGYICSIVKGGAGKHVLGKVHDVYFLNIQHARFSGLTGLCFRYWLHLPPDLSGSMCSEASLIMQLAETYRQPGLDEDDCNGSSYQGRFPGSSQDFPIFLSEVSKDYAHIVTGKEFKGFERFFQTKLEEYASYLLSTQWVLLRRRMRLETDLRELIRKDFFSPTRLRHTRKNCANSLKLQDAFVEAIFTVAWVLAGSLVRVIDIFKEGAAACEFRILPLQDNSIPLESFIVEAYPIKVNEGSPQFIKISLPEESRHWEVDPYMTVDDLEEDLQVQLGLRTRVDERKPSVLSLSS